MSDRNWKKVFAEVGSSLVRHHDMLDEMNAELIALRADNEMLLDVLTSCHQIFSHPEFADLSGIGDRVAAVLASKEQES